jgi:hypothetical protein
VAEDGNRHDDAINKANRAPPQLVHTICQLVTGLRLISFEEEPLVFRTHSPFMSHTLCMCVSVHVYTNSLTRKHTHTHTQGEPEEALQARIREAEHFRPEGHGHTELGQTPEPSQAPEASADKMAPEAKGEVAEEKFESPVPAPPAAAAPAEMANSNADATPPEIAPVAADAPAAIGGAG